VNVLVLWSWVYLAAALGSSHISHVVYMYTISEVSHICTTRLYT